MRRYTLRLDGFVSVTAPLSGGEFTTKPIRFAGKELTINYATSVAGSIQIEIQDAAGEAIPGFALANCPDMLGDSVDRVIRWKGKSDVSHMAGKPIRLRFVLKDADVYAFQFR